MKYKDGVIVSMTKMKDNQPVHLSASEKCMNDRLTTICTQFADHKEEINAGPRTRQK